jgi:hypothetical protein
MIELPDATGTGRDADRQHSELALPLFELCSYEPSIQAVRRRRLTEAGRVAVLHQNLWRFHTGVLGFTGV